MIVSVKITLSVNKINDGLIFDWTFLSMLTFDSTVGFKRPCFISSTHSKTCSIKVVARVTRHLKRCTASYACVIQASIWHRQMSAILNICGLVKKSEWTFFVFFFSRKCWESVRFAAAEKWFKPTMFFIDRTKAVIQHYLEKSFKKLKIENIKKPRKIRKTQNIVIS